MQDRLREAFVHHKAGRLAQARVAYGDVLDSDPRHPQALLMLGIILSDRTEDAAEAQIYFERLLDVEPGNPPALHNLGKLAQARGDDAAAVELLTRAAEGRPDFAPIFNDLGVSLHRLGRRDDALIQFDRAVEIDPAYGIAHDNRGMVLYDCRRFLEAAQAHFAALAQTPPGSSGDRNGILLHLAQAAYEAEELAAAERACRAILETAPDEGETLDLLAKVLDRQGRGAEALDVRNGLARARGLVLGGKTENAQARVLILGAVGAGHVPSRFLFDPDRFSTAMITLLSPDQPDAPLGNIAWDALSGVDVVFNSLGEVEYDGGQFDAARSFCAKLGKPVLNPIDRVAVTGRDQAPARFGGIDGLVVPETRWMSREVAMDAVTDLDGPHLLRRGGAHGGKDVWLVYTPEELAEAAARIPGDRLLLSRFYDFAGTDGLYRKYRFLFVDREPFAYHLAIGESWLVHYWRAEMGRSPDKKAEEERFLLHWTDVFPPQAQAAVRAVAQRLDLDYGGMDCAMLPDGLVLFFEANACMLLHLDDPKAEFPYKHQAVPKIRDAISAMVMKRAGR